MKLMAVTDDKHSVKELARKIIVIKDVIDFVQIREKTKTVQEILTLLDYLQCGGVDRRKIIMNDRLDIALCMNIPNLQLPEKGLPLKFVKKQYPHMRIGRSVHSVEDAKEAEREGADYVLYGHCFETNSKSNIPPNGMERILQMKQELSIPIYAIGGITFDKLSIVKQAEVEGIGVMSSIFSAPDPYLMAKKYYEAIQHETSF